MLKVLFVDDDENILKSFKRVLHSYCKKYEFTFVLTGGEALSVARTNPPDILFTDSKMPGMSGFELIAKMKEWFPKVVTVIVSGEMGSGVKEGEAAGYYLAKPCKVEEIVSILEEQEL